LLYAVQPMPKSYYALIVALCLTWAGTACGQFMKNEVVLSAGVGLADPTGHFEDEVKTGQDAMFSAGLFLSPSWVLAVRGTYATFDAEAVTQVNTGLLRINYLNADVEAGLMLYPESWFTPYISGGIGIGLERSWFETGTDAERNTDVLRVGMTGGVGISVHRQSKLWSLFTELVYHHYPTEGGSRQFVRWTTGLRLSIGGRPF